MWQIEFNAAQAAGGQRRRYRIRLTTWFGPIVWGAFLLALLAIVIIGGAGLALGVGRGLATSALAAALLFSILFGATLGAATMSHLRNAGLREKEGHLGGDVGVLIARGSRLVADEPFAQGGARSDGEKDRVVNLLAALERGDIEPSDFDAALDEELRIPKERTAGRSDRQADNILGPVD